jgi:hypothetical protein
VVEDRKIRKLGRRGGATLLTLGLTLGGFSAFAPNAFAEKPETPPGQDNTGGSGNNGTVKINGTDLDNAESNANDPMVQCPLIVTWDGFDTDARDTTVTVGEHKFNEGDTPLFQHAYTFTGGSFSTTVTPDLSGLTPTPNNGFHLDVIVDTALSVGQSITKTKVIWVDEACAGDEDPQTSSATIAVSKTVTGNNQPANPGNFSFDIVCTTGTVDDSPVSVAAGGTSSATVSWDGDTAPSCTVTESNPQGATSTSWAVGNGSSTSGTVASTGALTDGGTTQVAFTNDYTRQGGGCQVNCGPIPVVVDIPTTTVPTPPTTEAPRVEPEVIVPTTVPTQVEGVQIVAPAPPAPPAQVQPAQLARTGATTDHLVVAAGLCLLLGGIVLTASKERERTAVPARRR